MLSGKVRRERSGNRAWWESLRGSEGVGDELPDRWCCCCAICWSGIVIVYAVPTPLLYYYFVLEGAWVLSGELGKFRLP